MTVPRLDWPDLAEPVARALLGEPSRRSRSELRFGRRGSLSVALKAGTWFDHEAGEGGGVLDLVRRERRCSTAEALAWLESAGFLPASDERARDLPCAGRSTPDPYPSYPPEGRSRSLPDPERSCSDSGPGPDPHSESGPRERLARTLWAATVEADVTPGRTYLAKRFAWPPAGIGPRLLPDVRWLARDAAPARDEAAKWYGLPRGAVGALAFAGRRPGETNEAPAAVSLLAVSEAAERVLWFGARAVKVRVVGSRTRAAFEANPGGAGSGPQRPRRQPDQDNASMRPVPRDREGYRVHVAERELDALELSRPVDRRGCHLRGRGHVRDAPRQRARDRPRGAARGRRSATRGARSASRGTRAIRPIP